MIKNAENCALSYQENAESITICKDTGRQCCPHCFCGFMSKEIFIRAFNKADKKPGEVVLVIDPINSK